MTDSGIQKETLSRQQRRSAKGRLRKTLLSGLSLFIPSIATVVPLSGQIACPYDRPCITELLISTKNELVVRVNGGDWDVLNIRWSRPGRDGAQTEHKGLNAAFRVLQSTTPGVMYTVSVQGCNKRTFQSSRCTDWDESRIKAY